LFLKQIQYFVFNKISIKKIIVLYGIHFRDVKIQTTKKLLICGSSNEGLLAPLNNPICFSRLTEPSLPAMVVLAMKGQQRWPESKPLASPYWSAKYYTAKALRSCLAKFFQLFWHFMYFKLF
jgi:hypothetical protein